VEQAIAGKVRGITRKLTQLRRRQHPPSGLPVLRVGRATLDDFFLSQINGGIIA